MAVTWPLGAVSLVSGLARGVDSLAHKSALAAGGHTVGVLACSLDYVYPPEHADLVVQMAEKGAVVSEYLIDAPPKPGLFPVHNRIISGLSLGTIVVEAGLRSGSLITARHALDQGREVFAVPGPVTSLLSKGCNELLRQGAILYSNIEDLYNNIPMLAAGGGYASGLSYLPLATSLQVSQEQAGLDLPPDSANILNLIGIVPTHIDEIIRQSGLSPQAVTALLVDLELGGLVSQTPGRCYMRL